MGYVAVNEGLTKGARGAPANLDVLTQAALERLPAGAIIANDLGRIVTTNARAGELLLRTPASLRKALLADLVLDEGRPLLPGRDRLPPAATSSMTLRFESPSGPLPMLVSWSPVLFAEQDAFLLLMLPVDDLVETGLGGQIEVIRYPRAPDVGMGLGASFELAGHRAGNDADPLFFTTFEARYRRPFQAMAENGPYWELGGGGGLAWSAGVQAAAIPVQAGIGVQRRLGSVLLSVEVRERFVGVLSTGSPAFDVLNSLQLLIGVRFGAQDRAP